MTWPDPPRGSFGDDVAELAGEGEVEPAAESLDVEHERQAGGRAAQVRRVRCERADQSLQIREAAFVHDVEILRQARRSVRRRGRAAHDDEANSGTGERSKQRREVDQSLACRCVAARSSAASR